MEYENPVYDEWYAVIRGVPTEYHKRLADRVISCLGNWLDESKIEDVICDMRYHKRQIDEIYEEDLTRDRYDRPYHDLLKVWKNNEVPQSLNIS
jgi:hypothetical protein